MKFFNFISKENRLKFFFELFAVFTGVFLAFTADRLWDNYESNKLEKEYLVNLLSNIKTDTTLIHNNIDHNKRVLDALYNMQNIYVNNQNNIHELKKNAQIVFEGYNLFMPSDYVFNSLLASGDFRKLSDLKLNYRLSIHYLHYDNFKIANSLLQQYYDKLNSYCIRYYDRFNKSFKSNIDFSEIEFKNLLYNYMSIMESYMFLLSISLSNCEVLSVSISNLLEKT